MNAEYTFLVEKAKVELKNIESSKAEIARLALQACTIKIGSGKGHYTLLDFSKDIGIKAGTLSNWVKIYRFGCLNNGVKNPTEKEFSHGAKTLKKFKEKIGKMAPNERIKFEGHKAPAHPTEKGKKLIKEIHQGAITGKYDQGSEIFNEIQKDLKRIRHRAMMLDLETQDVNALMSSMKICDDISDMINLFLTNKKKRKVS